MPSEQPDEETLVLQIANQIINVANARIQDGVHPDDIAAGLRHAAANFSSFADAHAGDRDPGRLIEEFGRLLEYYWGRHAGAAAPGGGLGDLIEQVKREF